MREKLSELIVRACVEDPRRVVLSGDHGYALFDAIRSERPAQFINVGIMEQAMVGIAAGMARAGAKPIVYGLSAFVPLRVLEQIKLDVCHARYPVLFLGDGAGLVYSTLGASHQCGEDIAALRPLPGIRIYAPADEYELEACFKEASSAQGPAYIRIGKSDRSTVHTQVPVSTEPQVLNSRTKASDLLLVASGSMAALAKQMGAELGVRAISLMRLKPVHKELIEHVKACREIWVIDEHHRFGGLASTISDFILEAGIACPRMRVWSLKDQFVETCGSYQHALREHELADEQVQSALRQQFAIFNSEA